MKDAHECVRVPLSTPCLAPNAAHDFQPATYLAVCFVLDPASGMPHAAMGRLMPFTVK